MLKTLQEEFLNNYTQIIVVSQDCKILESTNSLFRVNKDSFLTSFHPFFYSIPLLFEETKEDHYFYCVQMDVLGKRCFYDIHVRLNSKKGTAALFILDLTGHYKSVHQIKQTRNESIIDFNISQELNNELEVQRGFKDKLLANVSHEIRTPLNSIVGFINVLKNTALDREQLDLVNIVKSSCNNLTSIVDDLLDISKIEAGHLEIKNKRFDFRALLNELSVAYRIQAEEKRLQFKLEIGENIPRFLVLDRLRISQILINLLDNAVKYSHEGTIVFRISTPSRNLRKIPLIFEVIDEGIGISPENTVNIFESFTQIEKRGLFGGAGLGLSIVKELVQLMEGGIEVLSAKDQGSTFRFTLDAGVSHDQKAKKEKKLHKLDRESVDGKRRRVLLGEDVEVNQLLMMKLFTNQKNYILDIAKNGEQVLLFLDNYKYDLILMDLTMPIMDGYDAAARIRNHSDKRISKIPIIALTARVSEEDREECKKIGMNAYLIKPIDEGLLFQTIEKLLNKYKRKKGNV
ncbi:MAG: signal transduction histidine kinase/CheY-like chemotaxis protein [Dokdonia sp.]|jgi:signal transduction histidine kinase/CheY-like chemotaxis protein